MVSLEKPVNSALGAGGRWPGSPKRCEGGFESSRPDHSFRSVGHISVTRGYPLVWNPNVTYSLDHLPAATPGLVA
jgi:hypothetical protein